MRSRLLCSSWVTCSSGSLDRRQTAPWRRIGKKQWIIACDERNNLFEKRNVDRSSKYLDYIKQQFALVGKASEKDGLTKDGPSDYILYTSGRRNVQFAHWWIKVYDAMHFFLAWGIRRIFTQHPSVAETTQRSVDMDSENRLFQHRYGRDASRRSGMCSL